MFRSLRALRRKIKAWRRLRVGLWRFRRWRHSAELALARRFGLATREDRTFFLLIPLVGVVAGTLGLVVHKAIDGLRVLLWGQTDLLEAAAGAPAWLVIGAPTLGGILIGLGVWLGRAPVSGGGMSVLIESVAVGGGKVEPRPILLRALASVLTVGSGGSLGREGPMIRLGAMISSWCGSRLRLPPHRVKVLVGCGAAAGLAAAYNVPVGGALFAMEIILGNFALEIFGPIVVSSVISTSIIRAAEGNLPNYAMPDYSLGSAWELLTFAGLGVVGALVSIAFVFGVRAGREVFERLAFLPQPLKPVLGMATLGTLVYLLGLPHLLGSGAQTIDRALQGELSLGLLLLLPVAKLVATSLTAGSGGSGGLFTPSLAVGAVAGGAFGYGVHALWPAAVSPYGAYAAVGMAAVAAGTSHAPISSIMILFEFTGNYELILPLMLAAITSSFLSRRLYPHSIYTADLKQRGVDVSWRMEEAALAGLTVKDLVRQDEDALSPGDDYPTVVERFLTCRRQRLFVVGHDGRLMGEVSLHDIKQFLDDPEAIGAVLAHDVMTPVKTVVHEDERLHRVAETFARSDHERLPVVGPDEEFRGFLAKRDLLSVYAQEVLGRPSLLATFISRDDSGASRDYVELPPGFTVRAVAVPRALVAKTLLEARLPQTAGVWVLGIKRRGKPGEERLVPDRDTVLRQGDRLIVLGRTRAVDALDRGQLPDPAEGSVTP